MKTKFLILMTLIMSSLSAFAQSYPESMLEPSDIMKQEGDEWVVKSGIEIADALQAKGWEVKKPVNENRAECSIEIKNSKGGTYSCSIYRSSYVEIHFGTKAETTEFYNKIKNCKPKKGSWSMNSNTVILD